MAEQADSEPGVSPRPGSELNHVRPRLLTKHSPLNSFDKTQPAPALKRTKTRIIFDPTQSNPPRKTSKQSKSRTREHAHKPILHLNKSMTITPRSFISKNTTTSPQSNKYSNNSKMATRPPKIGSNIASTPRICKCSDSK